MHIYWFSSMKWQIWETEADSGRFVLRTGKFSLKSGLISSHFSTIFFPAQSRFPLPNHTYLRRWTKQTLLFINKPPHKRIGREKKKISKIFIFQITYYLLILILSPIKCDYVKFFSTQQFRTTKNVNIYQINFAFCWNL